MTPMFYKKERAMKYCEISTEGQNKWLQRMENIYSFQRGGKYVLFIYELGSMV